MCSLIPSKPNPISGIEHSSKSDAASFSSSFLYSGNRKLGKLLPGHLFVAAWLILLRLKKDTESG